jgi:hypothetical protein
VQKTRKQLARGEQLCSLGVLFDLEDGGNIFLRNIIELLPE